MIQEFNVDWKAEHDQLNLAHVARNKKKYIKKKLKQTNASAHLVRSKSKTREDSPNETTKITEEKICER